MEQQHQEQHQEQQQEQDQPGLLLTSAASTNQGGSVASTSASSGPAAGPGPATAASGVRKEKKVAGGPPKSKAYANPLASRGDEIKYRTKFKQLKGKVKEIEEENQKTQAKILKAKRQIQRLRLERSILYERFAAAKQSGELDYASMAAESSTAPLPNKMRLPLDQSAGVILEHLNGGSTAGPPEIPSPSQLHGGHSSGAFYPHQQLLPRQPSMHSPTTSSVAGHASHGDQYSAYLSRERSPVPAQPFAEVPSSNAAKVTDSKALDSSVQSTDSSMQDDTAPRADKS